MSASNKLEIGVRLFGDAAKWADNSYVEKKGPSNVRMDVDIEWIKLNTGGNYNIAVFQRNHQRYAHLVANALLRHFNGIAEPLSTRHYLHRTPPHPRDLLVSLNRNKSQQWLTEHYQCDGSDQKVSIHFPQDTTHEVIGLPGGDVLREAWQIAYLSSRLPDVRALISNKVRLADSRPEGWPNWIKSNDLTCYATTDVEYAEVMPLTETSIRVAIGRNGASLNAFVSEHHTHYCEILEEDAIKQLVKLAETKPQNLAKAVSVFLDSCPIPMLNHQLLSDSGDASLLLRFRPKDGLQKYHDKQTLFTFKFFGTLLRQGVFPFYVARPTGTLQFSFDPSAASNIWIRGVYEHQLPSARFPSPSAGDAAHHRGPLEYFRISSAIGPGTSNVFPRHARLDILYGSGPDTAVLPRTSMASPHISDTSGNRRKRRRR